MKIYFLPLIQIEVFCLSVTLNAFNPFHFCEVLRQLL